jgi:tyrosyl-tRNA synthetase
MKQAVVEGRNPRDAKFDLGMELVARFHDAGAAVNARDAFIARFQKGAAPENIKKVVVSIDAPGVGLSVLMKQAGLAASTSAAIRLIEQGAVRLDGERVTNIKTIVDAGTVLMLQVGKREFAEITVESQR